MKDINSILDKIPKPIEMAFFTKVGLNKQINHPLWFDFLTEFSQIIKREPISRIKSPNYKNAAYAFSYLLKDSRFATNENFLIFSYCFFTKAISEEVNKKQLIFDKLELLINNIQRNIRFQMLLQVCGNNTFPLTKKLDFLIMYNIIKIDDMNFIKNNRKTSGSIMYEDFLNVRNLYLDYSLPQIIKEGEFIENQMLEFFDYQKTE